MAGPLCAFALRSFSLLLFVLLLGFGSRSCYADGSQFGFDIHHRFSDPVKGILGGEGLPVKGSVEYYVAMTQRDRIIRSRHLAVSNDQSPSLTFAGGNDTYLLSSFGYLHYANVSVGTPSSSFLVALDTGSDLFWLPCDCKKGGCIRSLRLLNGTAILVFNIYSPRNSSTSGIVSCNSNLCPKRHCPSASSNCSYEVVYRSNNTSSTGILVEDVLHLVTDDDLVKAVDTRITFGCGQQQLGDLLEGAAPNGLFGLGMENISVPSTLARNGIASNSFSMCFGPDGSGRITFGDNGSSDQKETPFNIEEANPTYNVSITKITVGKNSSEMGFNAIFDSSTSFTVLSDPAYTIISKSFDSQVQEHRSSNSQLPFEYCYKLSANVTNFTIPDVNLTMQGGDLYLLNDPIILLPLEKGYVYCLGLDRSEDINIIGQNFMTAYRIIFDRERMVLGWKQANCYDNEYSNSLPPSPAPSPAVSPPFSINPATTSGTGSNSSIPLPAPSSHSQKLKPFTHSLTLLLSLIFAVL